MKAVPGVLGFGGVGRAWVCLLFVFFVCLGFFPEGMCLINNSNYISHFESFSKNKTVGKHTSLISVSHHKCATRRSLYFCELFMCSQPVPC